MSNLVVISGKVVNDIAYFKDGTIGRVRLQHSYKDQKGEWSRGYYDVACFGYLVDTLRNIQKDDHILVVGRLTQNTFTNKGGSKVTATSIVANEINKVHYVQKAQAEPAGYPDAERGESGKLPWDE